MKLMFMLASSMIVQFLFLVVKRYVGVDGGGGVGDEVGIGAGGMVEDTV